MNRLLMGFGLLVTLACIKAPEIVMVDRATALEQQAGGSFEDLELKLTPEQLEALGIGPVALVDRTDVTDADRVDDLLRQRCIGEGRDGLLVDTHHACRGATDRAADVILIERVNHARVQLWKWMCSERKEDSPETAQRIWQQVHVRGVICGAWIQGVDGTWSEKKC